MTSIWTRIAEALAALAQGAPLSEVFDQFRTPPERSVAFTIAVIGLGAKMAKADGLVTRDEVAAFREVFHIPEKDAKQAATVFNLARQDVAGYEAYAETISRMFGRADPMLEDLVEGLFYVAMADGRYHPAENDLVHRVARIFGIDERSFRGLRTRFVPDAPPDAYDVLGVTPDMDLEDIRREWRRRIRDTHPDRMVARGLPEEAITLATKRMIALNEAWETLNNIHEDRGS